MASSSSSSSSQQRGLLISGAVAALAAAAAAAAGLYIYHKKQRASSSSSSTTTRAKGGGVPIPPGAVPEDAQEVLTQLFAQAADRISSLPDGAIAPPDRLLAYALYKQATAGDRSAATAAGVTPKPSKFNVIAHAKYTAWGRFEGMARETAMIKYIEASHYLMDDAAKAGIVVGGTTAAGGNASRSSGNSGPIPVESDTADIVYTKEDEYRSSDEDSDGDEEDDLNDVFGSHKNDDAEVKGMGIRQSIMLLAEGDEADAATEAEAEDEATTGGLAPVGSRPQQPFAPAPPATTTPRKRALIAAAMEGNVAKVRMAIDSGTDIAEADETGQTALHFAADRGWADCVALLLRNGADANSADGEGISALQAAVIGGDVECVRLLLKAGADPDHEDADGDTPRSCAVDDGSEEMRAVFAAAAAASFTVKMK